VSFADVLATLDAAGVEVIMRDGVPTVRYRRPPTSATRQLVNEHRAALARRAAAVAVVDVARDAGVSLRVTVDDSGARWLSSEAADGIPLALLSDLERLRHDVIEYLAGDE
jgi:hypothetical protein